MNATGLTFIPVKLFLTARVFIHTVGEYETTKKNDFSSRRSFINLSLFYTYWITNLNRNGDLKIPNIALPVQKY